MTKIDIINQLEAIEASLKDLRQQLLNDPEDKIRFPYFFDLPVTELRLEGHKQPQRFFNLCAQYNIYNLGQLVKIGRGTIAKWPNIGLTTITIVSKEFKDRFHFNW